MKTIPFTATHTYIAHIWQYPPPGIFLNRIFWPTVLTYPVKAVTENASFQKRSPKWRKKNADRQLVYVRMDRYDDLINQFTSYTTVEPRLTTAPFIRPPRYYGHILSNPHVKTVESFCYFDDPVNATTSLLRPAFYGPTVVALTGFHCTSITHAL